MVYQIMVFATCCLESLCYFGCIIHKAFVIQIVDTSDNNSFTIGSSLKIDHVHLRVSNLDESINF